MKRKIYPYICKCGDQARSHQGRQLYLLPSALLVSTTHFRCLRSSRWLWGALRGLPNVVTCQWIPTGLFGASFHTFARVSITTTILPLSAAPYSISSSTYTDGLWSWTFIANFLFGQERGKAIYGQLLEQPLLNARTHDTFWLAPLLDGGIASSSVHIPLYIYFAPPPLPHFSYFILVDSWEKARRLSVHWLTTISFSGLGTC